MRNLKRERYFYEKMAINRRKSHFKSCKTFEMTSKMQIYITHKILNILLDCGGIKKFYYQGRIQEDSIASFLGLDEYVDIDISLSALKKILQDKRENLADFIPSPHKELSKNIANLAKLLKLNTTECQILEFAIIIKNYKILDEGFDLLDSQLNFEDFKKKLPFILSISPSKIAKAISLDSTLNKTAILRYEYGFELISNDFHSLMMCPIKNIESIFKDKILTCTKSELTLQDYHHIKTDISLIVPFLKKSLSQKRIGVNILLYGPAGTGKTELVKVLAEHLKVSLYEISYYSDNRHNAIATGSDRLASYKIAQTILQPKTSILMYDEAEDIFEYSKGGIFELFKPQKNKIFLNRSLESNIIPTIWITNNISSVDPAVIRRFDYVLDMPIPPTQQRQKIISKYTENLLDEDTITQLNHHSSIAPSVIEKTSNFIKTSQSKTPSKDFRHAINNTLTALNIPKLSIPNALPQNYNLDFINTNINLKNITQGIKHNPQAKLCLYGQAGTGKSAYGKYLAQYLKLPYTIKKCSDLISPYIGMTEKNIAQAFNEATKEKSVLIFDEVDSFLSSRQNAQRSFEVSQVNEMLVQMEEFNGIFIATTNLIEHLDSASLRRFDLKIEFGFLTPNQVLELFKRECHLYRVSFDKGLEGKVSALGSLSVGDFDTIRRQSRFHPVQDCLDFYKRLHQEMKSKNQSLNNALGFVSQ